MAKILKNFIVPFERISTGYFEVEAATKEEAFEKAEAYDGKRIIKKVDTKFKKSLVEEVA